MKTIFLDVDGVLNNRYTKESTPMGYIGVDDKFIDNLRYIVDQTGAEIVLSSDWRFEDWRFEYDKENGDHSEDMVYLINKLANHGLSIADVTPAPTGQTYTGRGSEITDWLLQHPDKERKWVVLDDHMFYDFKTDEFKPHLVITYTPEQDDGHGGWTTSRK